MPRKKKTAQDGDPLSQVQDYRHESAKRKNNPPAKIAAWFRDNNDNGCTFCITQAFFPNMSVGTDWPGRSINVLEEDTFDALSSTTSLPCPAGQNQCIAVKVIDPRGNEVMKVQRIG